MAFLPWLQEAHSVLINGIIAVGVLLTYSRPTYLAVYIALILVSLVKKDKIVLLALLVVTAIAPFFIPQSIRDWARDNQYNVLRVLCNDDRIAIYRNTIHMIQANPLVGVGANTFMKNYRFYKENPEYQNVVTSDYVYGHNNFLHMAAEIGILGLCVFLWFLYALLRESCMIHRKLKDPFLKITLLGFIVSIVSFLVNGLTESSLYSSRVAILFWYCAGCCLGFAKFMPLSSKKALKDEQN
jgi:putative inorganic carbon (HCO3(-)) transporter